MRLLVLGKNGQVATSLQKMNPKNDLEVFAFGRSQCDIRDFDQVRRTLDEVKPDIVINASAYTAVDLAETEHEEAFALNADAVRELASLTGQKQIPIVHISTDYVFDGGKSEPYAEDDRKGPLTVYGSSKLAGETFVREANPNHVILRTAWVFSATGKNFLKTMLMLAETKHELGVVDDQLGNPTSSDDIANAIFAICAQISNASWDPEKYGTYHFCGPESLSWAAFARKIFDLSKTNGGPGCLVNGISTAEYPTPAARPANSRLDFTKFTRNFGYIHRPLEDSIRDVIHKLNQS